MDDFPGFMKRAANRIATTSQSTPGVEGYVFDGAGEEDSRTSIASRLRKTGLAGPLSAWFFP
jgi:hypothetical protein